MILLLILAPLAVRAAETAIVDVCLRCHGSEGLAANPAAPDLANQRRPYLEKQIADFRRNAREPLIAHSNAGNFTGQRDHPDMYAFANLFETETGSLIAALSARACRQASPPPGHTVSRPLPRPALVERCFACHGTQGARTVNAYVRRLAGQSRTYLAAQLFAMRRAEYGGEGSTALTLRSHPIMNAIAVGLTTDEIRSLADYLATLPCK